MRLSCLENGRAESSDARLLEEYYVDHQKIYLYIYTYIYIYMYTSSL